MTPRTAKKKNNYFSEETQKAIERFKGAESSQEKNDIFRREIYVPFTKMATHFVIVLTDNKPDAVLIMDTVTRMTEAIKTWDGSRGTKAFSYFNIVAKNHVLYEKTRADRLKKRFVPVQDALNSQGRGGETEDEMFGRLLRTSYSSEIDTPAHQMRSSAAQERDLRRLEQRDLLLRSLDTALEDPDLSSDASVLRTLSLIRQLLESDPDPAEGKLISVVKRLAEQTNDELSPKQIERSWLLIKRYFKKQRQSSLEHDT